MFMWEGKKTRYVISVCQECPEYLSRKLRNGMELPTFSTMTKVSRLAPHIHISSLVFRVWVLGAGGGDGQSHERQLARPR